jgi:hypothetical protein
VPQGADTNVTVTEYRFVIAFHEGRATIGESLGEALGALFPGLEVDLGDRVGAPTEPGGEGEEPTPPTEPGAESDATAAELLADAGQLLDEADAALREGDLGEYQSKVDEAGVLIDQALDLLESGSG